MDEAPHGSAEEAQFFAWLGTDCHIYAPSFIDLRMLIDGKPFHPLLDTAKDLEENAIDWVAEWPTFTSRAWPSLYDLCRVFKPDPARPSPRVVHLFRALSRAMETGRLPVNAYRLLSSVDAARGASSTAMLIENMDVANQYDGGTTKVCEVLESQWAKCDELLSGLGKQVQLSEWLVNTWRFQELESNVDMLKASLANAALESLNKLKDNADCASEVFRNLGPLDGGEEILSFVQYFLRWGSVLFSPLLEHSATSFVSERSRLVQSGSSMQVSLDFKSFGQVLELCYEDLQTLALGPSAEPRKKQGASAGRVDAQVWEIVVREFTKDAAAMPRELDLLFAYFTPSGDGAPRSFFEKVTHHFRQPDSLSQRRGVLEDACRLHTTVSMIPSMERALQLMGLDWAVGSVAFQHARSIAARAIDAEVDIEQSYKCMATLREGLGLRDAFDLNIFEVFSARIVIFDFFEQRGYRTPADMHLFQDTMNVVRGSLQENIRLRQALLDDLRHCGDVLAPLLCCEDAAEPMKSQHLAEAIKSIAASKPRPEAFTAVAENIALLKALFAAFDSVGGGRAQLLVFGVREILGGELLLDALRGTYSCVYRSAGGEDVVVSSQELSDYVARCSMSLQEGTLEEADFRDLRCFLEQMEAIVARSGGFLKTVQRLCEAGHPYSRGEVRLKLSEHLPSMAREYTERLGKWHHAFAGALDYAPLLGLVPRAQVFAWLARGVRHGIDEEMLDEVVTELVQWTTDPASRAALEERLAQPGMRFEGSEYAGAPSVKLHTPLPPEACLQAGTLLRGLA